MTSIPLTTSDISAIIPALNEEENITVLAEQLYGNVGEIILVDGGSIDNTVSKAKKAGLQVIENIPGRGMQLNRGAEASSGKILFFLHADSRLPREFSNDICNLINSNKKVIGSFRLAVDTTNPLLRVVVFFANLRSTCLQLPYGDQSFFLTKDYFNKLGGFPPVEIMEDYIFIREARKKGKIETLEKAIITSSRRWQRLGVFRTTIINQLMIIGYSVGISPKKLALFYRR